MHNHGSAFTLLQLHVIRRCEHDKKERSKQREIYSTKSADWQVKTMEYPWVELMEWIVAKQKNVERSQVGERKRFQLMQIVASEIESP